jgi:RNA polymerase sigma factor (sigma-70 family)
MPESMDTTLADRFEAHRGHLRGVAYRMLGSATEAEDAVQEAWLRLGRTTPYDITNLGGWLTTVVARICLDLLRSRTSRREDALTASADRDDGMATDAELRLADQIGVAMLVVLEMLAPAERIAFVLHDMFDLPFEDIAPIVGRSPTAARQLASRARRRVRGASTVSDADRARQHEVVGAFLAASRDGNFEALLSVLDPDVALHADPTAVAVAATHPGAPGLAAELRGATVVAESFKGRAKAARQILVDGLAGAAWVQKGEARSVFRFTVAAGTITAIEVIMDPDRIAELDLVIE